MCGICGMPDLAGHGAPDRRLVESMCATLDHRGPDSKGFLADGPLAMAMRRLSIIDLDGGDQPLAGEDGSVQVMQNGEIYNFRELGDGLRRQGHRLRTSSDTEVIAHLYEEHGTRFAEHLRGMFAVAVWDARRRRLVLARDPYGIKPLYYRHAGGTLSWASELKALLQDPALSREISLTAVDAYLAMNFVPAPWTIFEGVSKLPAGHLLIAEDGGVRLERFARPAPLPADEIPDRDDDELATELLDRLRESVGAHLVADVPVGVLLSGGLDSAAITALSAEQTSGPLSTFTIGFDEQGFSEVDEARAIASRYGTDHHELVVRPKTAELLPEIVAAFDEPFGDNAALPTYLVSELASQHVKVVLTGEGGDELFGGYYFYLGDQHADRFRRLAELSAPIVERLPSTGTSRRFDDRLKRFVRGAGLPPVDRHASWSQVFSPDARAELLSAHAGARGDVFEAHRARYAETAGADELSRMQDLDLGIYLVDDMLVKTDRASMATSLEARVPFLDPAVTNFALTLPADQKVKGLSMRRLYRKALTPLLPRRTISARKRGFGVPAARWLRGDLLPFARETLSPERLERQGIFDPAAVNRALEEHVSGREDLSRNLWGLITFSLWFDTYIQAPR